jgi:hypothetical protein
MSTKERTIKRNNYRKKSRPELYEVTTSNWMLWIINHEVRCCQSRWSNGLGPLEHLDRGFEPAQCIEVCPRFSLLFCVGGNAGVRTPSKVFNQMSKRFILSELLLNRNKPKGLIHVSSKHEYLWRYKTSPFHAEVWSTSRYI